MRERFIAHTLCIYTLLRSLAIMQLENKNGVQNTQTLASSATKECHESVPPSARDIATVLATTVHTQRQ